MIKDGKYKSINKTKSIRFIVNIFRVIFSLYTGAKKNIDTLNDLKL